VLISINRGTIANTTGMLKIVKGAEEFKEKFYWLIIAVRRYMYLLQKISEL